MVVHRGFTYLDVALRALDFSTYLKNGPWGLEHWIFGLDPGYIRCMKYIKSFNNLNESESIDYSDVDLWDSYSSEDEKNSMVDSIIDQVGRATGNKVISVSGKAGENDFDLEMELDNGDIVEAYYTYSPYPNRSRKSGYIIISYTRDKETFERNELDMGDSSMDAGEDIYSLVKDVLSEFDSSYVLELPREHFDTSGYHYDVDNETKSYMTIDVHFESEEEVGAWIDSLYNLIKKKRRS